MTTAISNLTLPKPLTADDLQKLGEVGRCELIYGELYMMSPAGRPHGNVAVRIAYYLVDHCDRHDLGEVLTAEAGYKVQEDLVRVPDVSFLRKERLPQQPTDGYLLGVPDLAVEVVSPGDSVREIAEKVNMWLVNGTQVVWVADPKLKTIEIRRIRQPKLVLGVRDVLQNEPLLPGFSLPLANVFKL